MTPKFIITSIVGAGAIGGGVFGCYNYLRPQEPEKTKIQETSNQVTDPKPYTQVTKAPDAPSERPQTTTALTTEPRATEPNNLGTVSS